MGFEQELKNDLKKKSKSFPRILSLGLQWVSVGYSSALYFSGKKFGKEIVSKELKSSAVKDILKDITSVFKDLGIGSLSVKELDEKKVVLTLKNGITSSGMSSVGKPVCFFEAGLIAGVLEGRLNKNIAVTETRCGGMGHPEDEFLVKL